MHASAELRISERYSVQQAVPIVARLTLERAHNYLLDKPVTRRLGAHSRNLLLEMV